MRSFKAWLSVETAVLRNCFFRTLIFLCLFTYSGHSIASKLSVSPMFIMTIVSFLLLVNLSFAIDSAVSLRKDGMIETILSFKFPIPIYPLAKSIIPTAITAVTLVAFSVTSFISGNNIFTIDIGIYVVAITIFATLVWNLLFLLINLLLPISFNTSAVLMLNMFVSSLITYAILATSLLLLNSVLICLLVLIILCVVLFCINCLVIKCKKQSKKINTI